MKKQSAKILAYERIEILIKNSLSEEDASISELQAQLAKKISQKFRLKLPYNIRQLYCKKCKKAVIPGRTSRIRVGRSKTKSIKITCLKCNHTYHKILS
ncbi:MAG: RNase P subunit [Nitrososphaeraceae archaeon]|nr:RNase P subunit [Nitrososphaeraceae archaeon]